MSKFSSIFHLYHHNTLYHVLRKLSRKLGRPVSVLDLGGGNGRMWLDSPLKFQIGSIIDSLVIVDIMESQSVFSMPHVRVKSDVFEFLQGCSEREFDVVVAFDVIEHLPKEKGFELLYEMERVAKNAIGIYTPNGPLWQPPSRNNVYNMHISYWTPEEFKALGLRILKRHIAPKWFTTTYQVPIVRGRVGAALGAFLLCFVGPLAGKPAAISAWRVGNMRTPKNQDL